MKKIVFIGAGSMAEALIQGWISNNVVKPDAIYVKNRSNRDRLEDLKTKYGVNIIEDLQQLEDAALIVLAMKPKDAVEALQAIRPFVQQNTAILSILAGIGIDTIENGLGERPIARAMPNTSATIGLSATGISFNKLVSDIQRARFLELLNAVGIVYEVEEHQLHAITALSGSGPAYIYYLLEAFEKVGLEYGLPSDIVRDLMVQTIAGSAAMVREVKEEPHVLRKKVTSPNGTTEAGIAALERHHFKEAIFECIRSAENRSKQLAKGQ